MDHSCTFFRAKPQEKPEEKKVEKKEEKKEEEKPKAEEGPVLKEPIIKLENNGQILVIKFVVSAKGKPTATWTAGGIPVKSAGKYYLGVQPNKQSPGDYFVTLELKTVSCSAVDLPAVHVLQWNRQIRTVFGNILG